MAELNDHSIWMKLAFLLMVSGYTIHLYSMDTPGWADGSYLRNCNSDNCRSGWYNGVEACEVIGYLCGLTAVMLSLCLTFLDEVKGNKIALICFIVFSIVAGFFYIVGVAVYDAESNVGGDFSTMLTVVAGLLAIVSGIFGIVEICKGGK